MAVFHDPAQAIAAALSIQDEVAGFNRDHAGTPIVLKLGLHQGSCIAVTAGGVLDYFGATVNVASRLEHACQGGEIVLSEAMLAEAAAREALAGRATLADSAMLRGVAAPVRFVRVTAAPTSVGTKA
jgi:class 3 adenylate cyclase